MKSIKLNTKYKISHAVSIFLAIYNYLPIINHQSCKAKLSNDGSRTLYFLRFLIIGILLCISFHSFAQKLVLKNSVSEQTYKIGFLRHVWISSVQDSTKTFGSYINKTKNDTLYFIGGKKIALVDINTIRLTPRNLYTRLGKPILYSTAAGLTAFAFIYAEVKNYRLSTDNKLAVLFIGTIYSSFLIEAAGTGFWLITPKRELRKGINLAILNK